MKSFKCPCQTISLGSKPTLSPSLKVGEPLTFDRVPLTVIAGDPEIKARRSWNDPFRCSTHWYRLRHDLSFKSSITRMENEENDYYYNKRFSQTALYKFGKRIISEPAPIDLDIMIFLHKIQYLHIL